jgi:hypothetical protein
MGGVKQIYDLGSCPVVKKKGAGLASGSRLIRFKRLQPDAQKGGTAFEVAVAPYRWQNLSANPTQRRNPDIL